MTKTVLLGMVAETPVHVGIGKAAEAIDLPVARESTTGFPHVPGSGVKGAWRVWFNNAEVLEEATRPDDDGNSRTERVEKAATLFLFGKGGGEAASDEGAGTLLFGEARLALLPVRSTMDSFKLVTCPTIINRLLRDRARAGLESATDVPDVTNGQYHGETISHGQDPVPLGLEEREFSHGGETKAELRKLFRNLMGRSAPSEEAFGRKFVVLSDTDFGWFATFGLPVAMRNALDENKIVKGGALWAEETLATDTVMWSILSERKAGAVDTLLAKFKRPADQGETKDDEEEVLIQMGGNETIGQGWFSVRVADGGSDA
ncbi:CRISPR-associated protein Cmr4 [Rhodobium orientis]|uniref:Type III-B CRISPR module RAMP protein Cmr4 n=1 Tax=Rhodobium orientis TaxID=34017 RepID=A0A327JIV8_9HYPH|nr:type III-B CRISPR module RAMP protein Cmr4 [Rhodobium orientis]MBB4302848.1 CRISPR-associated protein Cmr4 [Rhodobium orientis]RAI26249.1 type III-B CRISPR module RAMP protein Cmr4 [Rhodobium orientis]